MSPKQLQGIREAVQQAGSITDAVKILDTMIEETEKTFVCQIVWQMEDFQEAVTSQELEGIVEPADLADRCAYIMEDEGIAVGSEIMYDELYSRKEW